MNELIKVLKYEGSDITFRSNNGAAFINANDMARPFSKSPSKCMETTASKEYILQLETIRNRGSLVFTIEGRNGGTWMHEDVAMEFARWLSPKFSIWCNDRIKELMTTGKTAIQSIEDILANPDLIIGMATQLKEYKAKIDADAPKMDYYTKVLQSESLLTVTEVGQYLGMSAIKLNTVLRNLGVQRRVNGRWILNAPYVNKGYTKDKTVPYKTDADGTVHTNTLMHWTEKGKEFLITKLKS